MNRFRLGTVQLFSILLIANFMMSSIVLAYVVYSSLSRDDLIKAIHESDALDEIQTQQLLNATLDKSDRNYITLVRATDQNNEIGNQTIKLIKFLTDNFGSKSGYLERENFQYQQDNDTAVFVKYGILNQIDIITNQCLGLKLRNITCSKHFNDTLNQEIINNLTDVIGPLKPVK